MRARVAGGQPEARRPEAAPAEGSAPADAGGRGAGAGAGFACLKRRAAQLASGRQPFVLISRGQPHVPQCHMWHFEQAIKLCMTLQISKS